MTLNTKDLTPVTAETIAVGMLLVKPNRIQPPDHYIDPDTIYEVRRLNSDKLCYELCVMGQPPTRPNTLNIDTRYLDGWFIAPDWLVNPKPPETEIEVLTLEIRGMRKELAKQAHYLYNLTAPRNR